MCNCAQTFYAGGRCLCELAKQIGFMDQAQDVFKLEEQLSTFRHVVSGYLRSEGHCRIIVFVFKWPFVLWILKHRIVSFFQKVFIIPALHIFVIVLMYFFFFVSRARGQYHACTAACRLIVLTLPPLPVCLDVPTFAGRCPHFPNDARDPSSERGN